MGRLPAAGAALDEAAEGARVLRRGPLQAAARASTWRRASTTSASADVTGAAARRPGTRPCCALEAGAGYQHPRARCSLKAVYQHNRRDGGRVRDARPRGAAQAARRGSEHARAGAARWRAAARRPRRRPARPRAGTIRGARGRAARAPAAEDRPAVGRAGHAAHRASRPTAGAASCTWRPRRAAPSRCASARARCWTSATRRSCPTCWPITAGTTWTSRTTTARTTTCSRSRRRKRFDLGRYARGQLASRCASTGPGVVRVFCDIHSHMSAFILVFAPPLLRGHRRRGALPDRRRARRAPTPWWPGTTAQARETRAVRVPEPAARSRLDFVLK